jgi:hypothetical protein
VQDLESGSLSESFILTDYKKNNFIKIGGTKYIPSNGVIRDTFLVGIP